MKLNQHRILIFVGFSIWLLLCTQNFPESIFSLDYVVLLTLAAPLFLIPLAFTIEGQTKVIISLGLTAAISLTASFILEQGTLSGLLTLPWLLFCLAIAAGQWRKWQIEKIKNISAWSHLASYIYLPVGAAWAMADRIDYQPLGFDPAIVLLTAAHFHFAGFILPLITSWILPHFPNQHSKWIGRAVIAGIPLVALGITSSQLNWPFWIEMLAVIVMATGAAAVGFLHICFAWKNRNTWPGGLLFLGGIALITGMSLAFLYGIRYIFPISFLTIPWMYAVHGTLNAVGFAFPALLGWYFFKTKSNEVLS